MYHILFTADQKYAVRLPVVIKSIHTVHPGVLFHIHLIGDDLSDELKRDLDAFCHRCQYGFSYYAAPDTLFLDAPVNKYYSKAMYYRILAPLILPASIDRMLYLDPDILVINPLLPLWEQDMTDRLFAAASHTEEEGIVDNINRLRLQTSSIYYNTGVLMMNLNLCRQSISPDQVFDFIEKNGHKLLLPDQDVFNALYGDRTIQIPDEVWNYDARKYGQYYIRSNRLVDENWVIQHTVILHYCGKDKPWNAKYMYRFGNLYRHYVRLCEIEGWTIQPD